MVFAIAWTFCGVGVGECLQLRAGVWGQGLGVSSVVRVDSCEDSVVAVDEGGDVDPVSLAVDVLLFLVDECHEASQGALLVGERGVLFLEALPGFGDVGDLGGSVEGDGVELFDEFGAAFCGDFSDEDACGGFLHGVEGFDAGVGGDE